MQANSSVAMAMDAQFTHVARPGNNTRMQIDTHARNDNAGRPLPQVARRLVPPVRIEGSPPRSFQLPLPNVLQGAGEHTCCAIVLRARWCVPSGNEQTSLLVQCEGARPALQRRGYELSYRSDYKPHVCLQHAGAKLMSWRPEACSSTTHRYSVRICREPTVRMARCMSGAPLPIDQRACISNQRQLQWGGRNKT